MEIKIHLDVHRIGSNIKMKGGAEWKGQFMKGQTGRTIISDWVVSASTIKVTVERNCDSGRCHIL